MDANRCPTFLSLLSPTTISYPHLRPLFLHQPRDCVLSGAAINYLLQLSELHIRGNMSKHLAAGPAEHTSEKQLQLAVTLTYGTFKWLSPKKRHTYVCIQVWTFILNWCGNEEILLERDDYRQIKVQPERHKLTEGQQEIKSDFLSVTEEPEMRGSVTFYLTFLLFPNPSGMSRYWMESWTQR